MPAHDFADKPAASSPPEGARGPIQVEYYADDEAAPVGEALAMVSFGTHARVFNAPLQIRVELEPLCASPPHELWRAQGRVHTGMNGSIRYAYDDHYLFAELQQDEAALDVSAVAAQLYAQIQAFQQSSSFPHLLRMWNYLDAINEGAGDLERYRQFCAGRAAGLGAMNERFPAASAIGRQNPTARVQVFWLAARRPGVALENPRQISAYRYPRMHGPVGPTFSRAKAAPDGTVLISGTASIVGHASQHHDDPLEQLEETLRNLEALAAHPAASSAPFAREVWKVYVRNPAHASAIMERLHAYNPQARILCVAADICRAELLLEVEGVRMP